MTEPFGLPVAWQWAKFQDVASVDSNLTDPAKHLAEPHIAPNHIESKTGRLLEFTTVEKDGVKSSKHIFYPGHILYSKIRPYLAKAVVVDFKGLCSADMYPVSTRLDAHFLHRWMLTSTFTEQASRKQGRTVLPKINQDALSQLPVPVPPLNEQRHIVAKIEDLSARSRAAKEALDAIPPLLERFRQSVLAAAFRGDLTKRWREQNPDVEPASVLLERIRQERRQRWEEDYLAQQKAKGKTPKDDKWKAKYQEPEPVDTTDLPELPEGWCWVSLTEMGEMSRGKSKHRPRNDPSLFSENGVPFIQTGEIAGSDGQISSATKFYSEKGVAQSRVFPAGTVCITIAANIADSAILTIEACFPDSIVGIVCTPNLLGPEYLEYFIRTARSSLEMYAPATAQKNINLAILSQVAVPIPPVNERKKIVQILNEAFERVTQLQATETIARSQLSRLNQSILAKAFRGELVPQDPNDEPASVLLERIRAEREAKTAGDSDKKRKARK